MFKTILTHRGIDIPLGQSAQNSSKESRFCSFHDQISAGFGLEFDIQLMKDGFFAISHDTHLGALLSTEKNICLSEITINELSALRFPDGDRMCSLDEMLNILVNHGKAVSALHLKYNSQNEKSLDKLCKSLNPYLDRLGDNLILFDAKPAVAIHLKKIFPGINLAASVSHVNDIVRFGQFTGQTLLSPDEAISLHSVYSWVWLDEWDRIGSNCQWKSLVNLEIIERFREVNFKIAAVSPELHANSTGLLGNELHEIGNDSVKLKECWVEWSDLDLDALCTDHGSWLVANMGN